MILAALERGVKDRESPRYVEVVPLVDDLLRARAAFGDTLRVGRPSCRDQSCSWAAEVDSASAEMERARNPTHSAIALRRAATAGDSESAMDSQESGQVDSGMRCQPPVSDELHRVRKRHQTARVTLAVEATPRRRWVSNASSTDTRMTG